MLGPVSARDTLHQPDTAVGSGNSEAAGAVNIDTSLVQMLAKLKADGLRRSEAVKLCGEMYKLSRSVVYAKALSIPDW